LSFLFSALRLAPPRCGWTRGRLARAATPGRLSSDAAGSALIVGSCVERRACAFVGARFPRSPRFRRRLRAARSVPILEPRVVLGTVRPADLAPADHGDGVAAAAAERRRRARPAADRADDAAERSLRRAGRARVARSEWWIGRWRRRGGDRGGDRGGGGDRARGRAGGRARRRRRARPQVPAAAQILGRARRRFATARSRWRRPTRSQPRHGSRRVRRGRARPG